MKKLLKYFLILPLTAVVLFFTACEDDDYDYDGITPKVMGIDGPTEVAAHGITDYPSTYEVGYYREGSSITWSVETGQGEGETTIVTEDVEKFKAKRALITFPQRSTQDVAHIIVKETTEWGTVSAPDTLTVTLTPFCPYPMEDYEGDYTGPDPGTYAPTVTMETTDELNQLAVTGLAYFVNASWGENWTSGGDVTYIDFKCNDEILIPAQQLGETDYPDVYGIVGDGTVDTDNKVIHLEYEVFYGWDGAGGSSAATVSADFTLGGKMINSIVKVKNIKK